MKSLYEFRPLDEVKSALNAISPSFCAAKWYRSCLWLNSGQTASCHLPPAHNVDLSQVEKDERALHNTSQKFVARQEMLDGKRPSECSACWDAEDAGGLSDRIVKSRTFTNEDYDILAKAPANWSINPTHLEIAFGNKCNFACSYCNAEFSSRWGLDISTPYKNLYTSGTESLTKSTSTFPDANPVLVKAFEDWWPRLKKDLRVLRITGGEPLLSQDFWNFIERVADEDVPFYIGVNSNLGAPKPLIERLIRVGKKIRHFELYTSNEATHDWAEYIRDGIKYSQWKENLISCRDSGSFEAITVMSTLGALSGFGLVDFLRDLEDVRYSNKDCYIDVSLNLIRFPEFQSFLALPQSLRVTLADEYLEFMQKSSAGKALNDVERGTLERIVAQLLISGSVSLEKRDLLGKDLVSFIRQYDQRRKKSIMKVCPANLRSWLQSVGFEETNLDRRDKFQQVDQQL